ncbi:MAG TPA: sigma-54 dependent transcriptional regulator [Vicinamibacteria bacterium]|nr:sigma-54 dependent transcriptional regulator [Vicinamibacteria bacterium]
MTSPQDRILVIEDERAQRDALVQYLGRGGQPVDAASTGEEAVALLARGRYAVLITDLRLPGMSGLDVVRRAHEEDEELGVLLITAYASLESAVEALRVGAHDYLLKPLILEEVSRKVRGLLQHRDLLRENARLRRALQAPRDVEVVADSKAMKEVMEWSHRAAATRAIVLITGETGTGKEVVARAIHEQGADREEPFLAVNLAAVPDGMVESELFGHERGAFTGADRRREGILRAAGTGSVFLDEVAEMGLPVQAKLLRALEAREIQPLGSDATASFEARILVATHRDLAAMVREGSFREDLYYRLNVLRIHIPPLRERPEDIPRLVQQLLKRHASRGAAAPPAVSPEALRALCQHPWQGNVRELSNVLERALILAGDGEIGLAHLPADVGERGPAGLALHEAVDRSERAHIALVLRLCDGNRERAAEELGISPATLYRRIEKLGLKGWEVRPARA